MQEELPFSRLQPSMREEISHMPSDTRTDLINALESGAMDESDLQEFCSITAQSRMPYACLDEHSFVAISRLGGCTTSINGISTSPDLALRVESVASFLQYRVLKVALEEHQSHS
jgi:hypothetical protein